MNTDEILSMALASCSGVQSELARRIGRDPTMVNRWFRGRGRPSLSSLMLLAEVAGVNQLDVVREWMTESGR